MSPLHLPLHPADCVASAATAADCWRGWVAGALAADSSRAGCSRCCGSRAWDSHCTAPGCRAPWASAQCPARRCAGPPPPIQLPRPACWPCPVLCRCQVLRFLQRRRRLPSHPMKPLLHPLSPPQLLCCPDWNHCTGRRTGPPSACPAPESRDSKGRNR